MPQGNRVNSVNVHVIKVAMENTEPSRARDCAEGVTTQAEWPERSRLPACRVTGMLSARRFNVTTLGRRDSLHLTVTSGLWLKDRNAKGDIVDVFGMATEKLQALYDAADKDKWSKYRTKNATSALSTQLGLCSKELRRFLYEKGVTLRGADLAYIDGRQGSGVSAAYQKRTVSQRRKTSALQRAAKLNMPPEQHDAWRAKHRATKAAWTDEQRSAFGAKVSEHRRRTIAQMSDEEIEAIEERLRRGRKRSIVVDNVRFDSTWEVPVYQLLQQLNVEFQYAGDGTTKLKLQGLKRYWRPDFIIPSRKLILEVKGDKRATAKFWARDMPAFLMTKGPHLNLTVVLLMKKINPHNYKNLDDLISACVPVYGPDQAFLVSRPVKR